MAADPAEVHFSLIARRVRILLLTACFFAAAYSALGGVRFHPEMRLEIEVSTAPKGQAWRLIYKDRVGAVKHLTPRYVTTDHSDRVKALFALPIDGHYGDIRLDPGRSASMMILHGVRVHGFTLQRPLALGPGELEPLVETESLQGGATVRLGEVGLELAPDSMQTMPALRLDAGEYALLARVYKERAVRVALALVLSVMLYYTLLRSEFLSERIAGHTAYNVLLSAVVVIFLCLPVAGVMDTGGEMKLSKTEKRALAAAPSFSMRGLSGFPVEYEKFFNDRFLYREWLIGLDSKVSKLIRGSYSRKVTTGPGGWMFLGSTIDDYRCVNGFSYDQLEKIRANLEARRIWLNDHGIGFYVIIVPNKASVYTEELPRQLTPSGGQCRYDQVVRHMEKFSMVPVVDIREALRDAKAGNRVYFKYDPHWNEYGALLGVKALVDRIRLDRGEVPPIDMSGYSVSAEQISLDFGDARRSLADLEEMRDSVRDLTSVARPLHDDEIVTRAERIGAQSPEEFKEFEVGWSALSAIRYHYNKNSTLPGAMLFGESFAQGMSGHLARSFGEVVTLWQYPLDKDMVLKERPEVVVLEVVERRLDFLLEDPFYFDLESMALRYVDN